LLLARIVADHGQLARARVLVNSLDQDGLPEPEAVSGVLLKLALGLFLGATSGDPPADVVHEAVSEQVLDGLPGLLEDERAEVLLWCFRAARARGRAAHAEMLRARAAPSFDHNPAWSYRFATATE
jgi:hypothetical protein